MIDKDKLASYFQMLESLEPEDMMKKVDSYLDDDTIELFVSHLEDFYGVEDDEELGMLAQIMVSGFIAGLEIK